VTVAHIVERAGVSRRTFYELFADREECFLAALDEAIGRAGAVVLPTYGGAAGWRERVRAGLAALLCFLDDEPGTRALLVVEALGAGPRALERRALVIDALIAAVDEGRSQGRGANAPPLAAEGVVGAVLAVIHARVTAGMGVPAQGAPDSPAPRQPAVVPLIELFGPLMGMIVLPYLGASAARKESERPAPIGVAVQRVSSGNPLEGLKMRLTYRTLCVLRAVARHPASSNRDIGAIAGMTDQGQISKLLARLDGLGLIANVGEGHVRGAANAWRLSERGEQVERSLRG
jgi:AcrR family transcriptional regulator